MASAASAVLLVGLAASLVAGCSTSAKPTTTPQAASVHDGWAHYAENRLHANIACGDTPISLDGNRLDVKLTGACRNVRITGEHSDIQVSIVPGGTIEITGAHNDVTWRQTEPGPKPTLKDTGVSNDFHEEKD